MRALALAALAVPLLVAFCGAPFTGRAGLRGPQRAQRNPYEVLGVASGASWDDVRAAFRKLARTYHPDVPDTGDEDRFRSIREALEQLGTPAGRARWSSSQARASYSSYTSDFSSYNGYSYSYETRGDYGQRAHHDRKRRQTHWREREQESRRATRETRKKNTDAKKAQNSANQDVIMERELKKAITEAKRRQQKRRNEWSQSMKEARKSLNQEVKEEMETAWNAVHRFYDLQKELVREENEKWRAKLEATRHASANARKEDGEEWVQKFAEVKQQAADVREELDRRFAEKWRQFREGFQGRRPATPPEKVRQEIEELLKQQDERISECWSQQYKDMMKSVQRSMNNEPKLWKDRFRTAMIQLGRGGANVQQRWIQLFQETMKDLGEQEMKEVRRWADEFKSMSPWTAKERAKRAKLTQASRKLKPVESIAQRVFKTIDQCRKADIQRLKWKAWNRGQWVRKFRQEQDRIWKSLQEEELRMTEEYWEAVKASQLEAQHDVQS